MPIAVKLSIIVLLIGASCARVHQEDQAPPSGESHGTDPNGNPTVEPNESPAPAAGLSAPSGAAADANAGSEQGGTGYLPLVYFSATEMDRNSGDVRGEGRTADGSYRYGIRESDLSKEVRRLGIPIPDQRDWVVIHVPTGTD